MSSKKKQGPSVPKKASFFSFGRNKAKEAKPNDNAATSDNTKTEAETNATADTALTSALFSTKKKGNAKSSIKEPKKSSKRSHVKGKQPIITVHKPRLDAIASTPIPSLTNQIILKPGNTEQASKSKQELNSSTNVLSDDKRDTAATKIQAAFKGHRERRNYVQKRLKAIKVEALARGFLARKQYAKMKTAEDTSTPATITEQEEKTNEMVS
ncbi:unnamed protein product [Orchesella dallaii]|uniref:Uncharacterized protein n=1 Tax=Orchesella dallaii TaxID=48710 RepID=A0ABP1RWZ3_9HEXA